MYRASAEDRCHIVGEPWHNSKFWELGTLLQMWLIMDICFVEQGLTVKHSHIITSGEARCIKFVWRRMCSQPVWSRLVFQCSWYGKSSLLLNFWKETKWSDQGRPGVEYFIFCSAAKTHDTISGYCQWQGIVITLGILCTELHVCMYSIRTWLNKMLWTMCNDVGGAPSSHWYWVHFAWEWRIQLLEFMTKLTTDWCSSILC